MPKKHLGDLCASVRRCIDDLNTVLETAEELAEELTCDCGDRATRTAYKRLATQLAARQSELEDRIRRLTVEGSPMSDEITSEIELTLSQLEKPAHAVSREIGMRVGHIRGSLDSKPDKTQREK